MVTAAVAVICVLGLAVFWRLAVDADDPALPLEALVVYIGVLTTHGLWRAEQHAAAFRWSAGVVITVLATAFWFGTDATPSTIAGFWILTLVALVYNALPRFDDSADSARS